MIEEFKDFWSRYIPYQLHPEDKKSLYNSNKAQIISENPDKFLINIDIDYLNSTYSKDLKNNSHNDLFQRTINPNAIHTNLYSKTFIGDIENARIIILYGNPGLKLGDYMDEHEDNAFINELNNDLSFSSNGFLFLRDVARKTGGFNYWKNGNRFKKIIHGYSKAKGISISEANSFLTKNICLIESIGYHSTKTPLLKPHDFSSSLITKELVHKYFLPKARKGELIIFSWRQSSFWDLEPEPNVVIRNPNAAINSHFTNEENKAILNFLTQ